MSKSGRLLLILLLFAACQGQRALVPASDLELKSPAPTEVVMLHISDVYEIAALENGTAGGMARVASLREELLEENPNTLTVLPGDFLNPSVIGTVKLGERRVQGAQMVEVMNKVKVDFVTFGNHEFDLEEADLQSRLNESDFEWISSNVFHKTASGIEPFYQMKNGRKVLLPSTRVVEIGDASKGESVRIGFFAITLPFNQRPYVHYEDPYAQAVRAFETLRTQADFVVALTHQNLNEDLELARRIPELALIVGGHEHENSFNLVEGVPIAKPDANAKSAYVHRIRFNRTTKKAEVSSTLKKLDQTVPEDRDVAKLVKDWENKAYRAFEAQGFLLNQPVATLHQPLDGLESHIRAGQTNLGDAITEAMLEGAGDVDLALLNSGSIRIDDYLRGEITQFDIIRALPFGGKVLKVTIKGSLLQQVLDVGRANVGTGGFLQMANVSKDNQGNWTIAGAPLDHGHNYRVAISDFLMSGREVNFDFLTRSNPHVTEIWEPPQSDPLRDIRLLLLEHLRKVSVQG